jgi:predicted acylesterase/phospholipase RssA
MNDFDTLILPGGGIKGIYLLGGLHAFYEKKLTDKINNFIGTSVGSIICYLLCIGFNPLEILVSIYKNKIMEKLQNFSILKFTDGEGAINFNIISEFLEKLTIEKFGQLITLGKLKELCGKTLICVTYNMTQCCTEYLGPDNFPDLACITAIRMSSNIPLIFGRFLYMNNFYIDGGMTDNFPIEKAEEIGKKILGLNLQLPEKSLQDNPQEGILMYILRLLQIPIIQLTLKKTKNVKENSTVFNIKSGEIKSFLNFNLKSQGRLDMFSEGYCQVKDKLI